MDLANMRRQGVHHLIAFCHALEWRALSRMDQFQALRRRPLLQLFSKVKPMNTGAQ
jgi:hypothetical protein